MQYTSFRRTSSLLWLTAAAQVANLSVSAAGYPDAVAADKPLAYYRFNDTQSATKINLNSGSLGPAGNATNDLSSLRPFPGAITGSGDRSEFFDSSGRTIIPFNPALNPVNTTPFTMEAWFYPASDQINGGQCPINNRYAYSGAQRQGWVIFQRAQDDSYAGKPGFEGVGWNFRMYNENGGSSGLDVVSGVPYQLGKWTHVAVVYDPKNLTDSTLTMYINGVPANTNIWNGGSSGSAPGYVANTGVHDAVEAANGPAGLSFGMYNNTASPNSNPYFGGIDEFAFYSTKLTDAQILAHYQNGTNSSRATPYETLIKSESPVAYLRLDELAPGPDVALNIGNLQSAGVFTYSPKAVHPGVSALAGHPEDGSFAGHNRNGGGSFVNMPWAAQNNPDASVPFSLEAWFRPTGDDIHSGKAPINNRLSSGAANRTGWVIFQRDPNDSYTGTASSSGEGMGWAFRPYKASGSSSGGDVVTSVPYKLNEWQQVVFTWAPQTDLSSDSVNGGVLWEGVLTAYVDGVAVNTNSAARYQANAQANLGDDAALAPVDFAVGSYNVASGGGSEFEGNIDEVAFYNSYLLTPEQVLAHYQAATNSHSATNYESLVLNAAYDPTKDQRSMPATYLRFADPAFHPATNSGSLGSVADGALVLTANSAAGPQAPSLPGFESANSAVPLDGQLNSVSLNNPPGLNVAGQVTLEAWVKPAATQGELARIISHGPPTLTADTTGLLTNNVVSGSELFLRLQGSGSDYAFGSSDGTNTHAVTFAVPAGDLGSANWIHLAGTYDGSHWTLFRNGVQVATATDPVGALPVNNGDWSIGSTGQGWADNFAGTIDEVAIYNSALTPARVQAHYAAATSASSTAALAIASVGGKVSLTWAGGTLQQSDKVTGPFVDVPGATSPRAVTLTGSTQFYRLH
jgi:hypothetical protein